MQAMEKQKSLCIQKVQEALEQHNPHKLAVCIEEYQHAHKSALKKERISIENLNNVVIVPLIHIYKNGTCSNDVQQADPQLVAFLKEAYKNIEEQKPAPRSMLSRISMGFGSICLAFGVGNLLYDIYTYLYSTPDQRYSSVSGDLALICSGNWHLYNGLMEDSAELHQARAYQMYAIISRALVQTNKKNKLK